MEFSNQEALNEYLERVYVEPCLALYEMLSDHSKDVSDFWNVIVPNWKRNSVNGTLAIALAAFGYSAMQAQSIVAQEENISETTSVPTATRTPRLTPTQVADPRCLSFSADINPETAFVTWVLEAEGRGGWTLLSDSAVVDQGRVSTGALGYTHQAQFGTSYEVDVLFDGEEIREDCGNYVVPAMPTATATSTPGSTITLQPWVSSTPTETITPDLTATATYQTPVFITLVPTKTSTPTVTSTGTPIPTDENNLYIPIAPK